MALISAECGSGVGKPPDARDPIRPASANYLCIVWVLDHEMASSGHRLPCEAISRRADRKLAQNARP